MNILIKKPKIILLIILITLTTTMVTAQLDQFDPGDELESELTHGQINPNALVAGYHEFSYTNIISPLTVGTPNVGVTSDLQVTHTVFGARIRSDAGSAPTPAYGFSGMGNGGIGMFRSGNDLRFSTGGNTRLTINPSGYVGIGVTNPSQQLHVNGNIALSGGHRFIGTTTNNALHFRTNNQDRMTISSSGSVGIGTTTPSPLIKLDVVGSIRASGIIRSNNAFARGEDIGIDYNLNLDVEGNDCTLEIKGGIITGVSCCIPDDISVTCQSDIGAPCGQMYNNCGELVTCPSDSCSTNFCGFSNAFIGSDAVIGAKSGFCQINYGCNPAVDLLGYNSRGRIGCALFVAMDNPPLIDDEVQDYLEDVCCQTANFEHQDQIIMVDGTCEVFSQTCQSMSYSEYRFFPVVDQTDTFLEKALSAQTGSFIDCALIQCGSEDPPTPPEPPTCYDFCISQGNDDIYCDQHCALIAE